MNTETSVFTRIINRELPATILYESEQVIVIENIEPKAPIHYLAIPKHPYVTVGELVEAPDTAVLLHELFSSLYQLAKERGIAESGYRIITNNGHDGGQSVPHLHFHLLGGTSLKDWDTV